MNLTVQFTFISDENNNMALSRQGFRIGLNFYSRLATSLKGCHSRRHISLQPHYRQKWDLACAVYLERCPTLIQEKTAIETQYEELQTNIEVENSLLSDHELRHNEDIRLMEKRKQEDYEETEADALRQTAIESEDAWDAEHHEFTPASRLTEADQSNDEQSHNRKLDRKLVLLVKQKLGDKENWVMPTGLRSEGESMREAAERVLTEICGVQIEATFLGNAPCGEHKYQHSPFTEGLGTKVFFFQAHLDKGNVETTSHLSDYKWVPKEDFERFLAPSYRRKLDKFVLDL